MRISSVPVFLAGFGCLSIVAAYFLSFSPSQTDMRLALNQHSKTGFVSRGTCSKVEYDDMNAMKSDKYPVYKCDFITGESHATAKPEQGYFFKSADTWFFNRNKPKLG